LRGQPHQPWRPLDQLLADPVFQPLQLHADRALRRAEHVCGARETLEVGDRDECPDSIDVQRNHPIIQNCCR